MAEAKTAAEIEDILSSIRRLVSQDRPATPAPHRPQILSRLVVEELSQPSAVDPAPVVAPAPKGADILVLTPAQRVAPAPVAVAAAKPAAVTWPESGKLSPHPAEAARAAESRLHLDSSLAWEAEMGDPAPDLASLDWSSFTFARRPMAETYAARSRAAERARPEAEPVAPAFRAAAPEAVAPEALAPEAEAEPMVLDTPVEALTEALVPVPTPVEPTPAEVEAPEAAAPEAAPLGRLAPEDFAAESDFRDSGLAEADFPEAQLSASDAMEAEPVEPSVQEEDSIFSEEVLRELVRDLIREQLQGELGERITRNIRKLIKAEIARSLEVRALE